jgi:O-antigen ligase
VQPTPEATPDPGIDVAGQISNEVRVEQFRVLMGHIVQSPIVGRGFGSIAADYRYGQIFSYELAYLDLLFKAGVVGLVLFLSFPLRLLLDAMRGRLGRIRLGPGVGPREASVVVGVVAPLLVTGGTNPYLLAAFGLFPILTMIAWLDPSDADHAATPTR